MLTESDQNLSVTALDGYQVARGMRCWRVEAIAGTVRRILIGALAWRQSRTFVRFDGRYHSPMLAADDQGSAGGNAASR